MPLVPNEDRFYRQYYGGLRVQSTQHTHIVDVSFGQNEAKMVNLSNEPAQAVDNFASSQMDGVAIRPG